VQVPSSLRNIYKELSSTVRGFRKPTHGSLVQWAKQGVLLLNTGLTVRAHEANSHKNKGWQRFTDAVISLIAEQNEKCVFVLWGGHAKSKAKLISHKKERILESPHPSGLSAHRGFFGCNHFNAVNEMLEANGDSPIDWQIE
jgi:uracil-DNA glycosylase